MKPRVLPAAALSLTAAMAAAWCCRAQTASSAATPSAPAGEILNVQCEPRIQPRKKDPVAIGLILNAGDIVECAGKGYLELLLPEGKRVLTHEMGQLKIDEVHAAPYPEILNAIRRVGVSGATRGNAADARVRWPADGSVIVPEHFEVRWAPVSQKVTVAILSEAKDATVWGPAELDGVSGRLKSEAAAAALEAYKKKSANPRLVLTVTFGEPSDWEEVHFSLLAGRPEQELNTQLDFWAKHTDGLALHLGRGYTFQRYKLFSEGADEYETALTAAPDSPYLLTDAIDADRLAGRLERANELQSRLASQAKSGDR